MDYKFERSKTIKNNGFHIVCEACGDTRLRPFEQTKGLCSTCYRIVHYASMDVERDNEYVKYEMYRNPMDCNELGNFEDVESLYQGEEED